MNHLFDHLTENQYQAGLEWLADNAVTYEHDGVDHDWIRLIDPTDEQAQDLKRVIY
jgi:hypothetical protein